VAARRTRIDALVRRGDRKAKTVQTALQDLYRQLSAAQLGITVASILLGYVAQDTVAHLFHDWFAALPAALSFLTRGGVASTVAVAVISFLHVVFGEQAPKAWAITYPEGTSRWVAAPLIFFSWVTRPFTELLNWSSNLLVRMLGITSTNPAHDRVHSPEEIRMLVEQSRKTGGLGAGDARLLEGVFEFSEKNAREVMTPRTEIVALPAGASLAEAAGLGTEYRGERDERRADSCRCDRDLRRESSAASPSRRRRLHDDWRIVVRPTRAPAQGGRSRQLAGRYVRNSRDGWPAGWECARVAGHGNARSGTVELSRDGSASPRPGKLHGELERRAHRAGIRNPLS